MSAQRLFGFTLKWHQPATLSLLDASHQVPWTHTRPVCLSIFWSSSTQVRLIPILPQSLRPGISEGQYCYQRLSWKSHSIPQCFQCPVSPGHLPHLAVRQHFPGLPFASFLKIFCIFVIFNVLDSHGELTWRLTQRHSVPWVSSAECTYPLPSAQERTWSQLQTRSLADLV